MPLIPNPRLAPPLVASLLLIAAGGCTDTGTRYPSLLPRPIESVSLDEPVRTAPVAAPDPALDQRIATLSAGVDKAQRDFAAASQDAEAKVAVARGVPQGSDAWLDAQTAIASLGAAQGAMTDLLTEIEELAIERGRSGQPAYPTLDALVARASTLSETQSARSRMLEGALATP